MTRLAPTRAGALAVLRARWRADLASAPLAQPRLLSVAAARDLALDGAVHNHARPPSSHWGGTPPLRPSTGHSTSPPSLHSLVDAGLVRAIGLSNVGPNRLEALLASPDLRHRPAVVQTEMHPYLQVIR